MEENPDQLLSMLVSIPGSQPIRSRILNMWPYWKDGLRYMQKNKRNIDTRNRKKVSAVTRLLVLFGLDCWSHEVLEIDCQALFLAEKQLFVADFSFYG